MMNDEDQPVFLAGAAARAQRYAKGSNPHRGHPGPDCRLWNMGWTAQNKKERDNARQAVVAVNHCRTDGCPNYPNDGEGWDGFCGSCADKILEAEENAENKTRD